MNISKLIRDTLSADRYSDEYTAGWRSIFQHADTITRDLRSQTKGTVFERDVDASTIVDALVLDHELYTDHCNPDDDAQCGDESCISALSRQQDAYILELYTLWWDLLQDNSVPHHAVERAYQLLKDEVNTSISSVSYETYESLHDSAKFDNVEYIDDTQKHINRVEYHKTFKQDPECDPDDSHYVGDTTRRNNRKPRGNVGLLNGVYQQTDAEPSYRPAVDRKKMLLRMMKSDNPVEIRLAYSCSPLHKRDYETRSDYRERVEKRNRKRDLRMHRASRS
jgi:hypothetical protein